MNKKQAFFVLIVLLSQLILSPNTNAQKLSKVMGSPVLAIPKDYYKGYGPTGEILPKNAKRMTGTGVNWVVFSDRNDNATYQTPQEGTIFKKVQFMDAFFVLDEDKTGNFIRIVKYDPEAINFASKKITKDLEDFGWVAKSKMLLWKSALVDPQTKFQIKALTVNKIEMMRDPAKFAKSKKLRFYNDAQLTKENENDVRLYEFLFIYKKEGNAYLIGKTNDMAPVAAKFNILGWCSADIVQEWKQRLTMEPNWDDLAVEDRKGKNVKASLLATKEDAITFKSSGSAPGTATLWAKDPYEKRFDPQWKRLPVLEKYDNGVIKSGVVTGVYDTKGNEIIKTEDQVRLDKEYNATRDKFRNINIVFVIDGSAPMKPYFPPVVQAISESMNSLTSETNNSYKIGAVVYRDYSEKDCPGGDKSVEQQPLTKDYAKLSSFIQGIVADDCKDKDKQQAVNLGLYKALRMLADETDKTNVIILVGSAGNRTTDNQYTDQQIQGLMVQTGTSLLAFQVNHPNGDTYEDFVSQCRKLIVESSKKILTTSADKTIGKAAQPPHFEQKKPTVFKMNYPDFSPIPGSLIFTDIYNPMKADFLKEEISSIIHDLNESHEKMLAGMDSKIKGQGERAKINEGMYYFLSKMNVSQDLLQKTAADNIQFFIESYTPVEVSTLKYPLYKYTIFVDEEELYRLKTTLEDIFKPQLTPTEVRTSLVNAYKSVVMNFFGEKQVKEIMGKKTAAEIMALVTGLPSQTDLLKKYKVDDFEDKRKISDDELQKIYNGIRTKLDDLSKIAGNAKYNFRSSDNTYYWVPQDVLP